MTNLEALEISKKRMENIEKALAEKNRAKNFTEALLEEKEYLTVVRAALIAATPDYCESCQI